MGWHSLHCSYRTRVPALRLRLDSLSACCTKRAAPAQKAPTLCDFFLPFRSKQQLRCNSQFLLTDLVAVGNECWIVFIVQHNRLQVLLQGSVADTKFGFATRVVERGHPGITERGTPGKQSG